MTNTIKLTNTPFQNNGIKLGNTPVQNIDVKNGNATVSGSTDHNTLKNRDLKNQHPISAIIGLQEELDSLNKGSIYVGSGDMPENCNVQIDPNGTTEDYATTRYVDEKLSEIQNIVDLLYAKSLVKTVTINLLASDWVQNSDNQYSQIVSIDGINEYSKVDLQPTAEQLIIFHEKDITFVTENEDGIVTVFCIGQKPMNDYTIQATVKEVIVNG